jgi:hypothetical protein
MSLGAQNQHFRNVPAGHLFFLVGVLHFSETQYFYISIKDRPAHNGRSSVGFGSGRCQIAVRITDIHYFGVGFIDGSENECGIWISFPYVRIIGQAPILPMAANSRLWLPRGHLVTL